MEPQTPQDPRDASRAALESLEQIRRSLESLGSTPPTPVAPAVTAGVGEGAAPAPLRSRFMSQSEMLEIREALKPKSLPQLLAMFGDQSKRKDVGVPFDAWLANGGTALATAFGQMQSNALEPEVAKMIDTGGASALIRQDLEPILYEIFIRLFPAYDRFPKEPANGLVHTWQQITDFGDAVFMPELGTVTDDRSTYVRKTTNIAILATRRGISLKSQFATVQSGSGFNPEQLEMTGGLRAIAAKMQRTIFQGQATDSGGDADSELGVYDPDGFTGLRSILNTSRAVSSDVTAGTPTWDDLRAKVSQATVEIMNKVTTQGPLVAYLGADVKEVVDEQQDKNVRYTGQLTNVAVGVQANSLNTAMGPVPLFVIPGDAIGSYHRSGNLTRDVYLVDESTFSLPYLGSPGPTVLDIPIGVSGQLTHLFIIFLMSGLAAKAPIFSNKVRVKVNA